MVCNRAVERWDEEVTEAIRPRREARATFASSKSTSGWEEYAIARNKIKEMVEKKGTWKDVAEKTSEDVDGGVKQMCG